MKNSRTYLLLLGIILVAFALRMYQLDFFSLRGDEAFTVLFVQKPLAQMWHETLTVEPNPPLLYFALRGWIALAGDSEFATRFFSAWFGVLCVALTYRLAREIFGKPYGNREPAHIDAQANAIAFLAAFLITINPYQIWHSQDVRNYTMWPALSLLALIFFWQWYDNSRKGAKAQRKFLLIFFVLAELFALYAHYYEAFILLALNLFVFATQWRDLKKLAQWLAAQIVLALLYLPYPLILSNRVSAYGEGSGRQGVALWDMARETFGAFVLGETLDAAWCAWLWTPFALLAFGGLIYLFTRDWKRGLFFALYAGVPTIAVFALNTFRPLYLERYLNGIAPAYYLLLAYGIVQGTNAISARVEFAHARRAGLAFGAVGFALIAFFALQNYWTNPAYAKAPDWRGLTNIINANAQPGDLIVQNFPEMSLLYYDRTKLPLVVYPETFLPDIKTAQQLNAMNANYQRVWFIPAATDYWDPDGFVQEWLDRRNDLLDDWSVGDFRLRLYATPSQFLNTMQRTNTNLKPLTLLGYRTQRQGDNARVVLYWRAQENLNTAYTLNLTFFDARGNQVRQINEPFLRGEFATTEWRKNQIVVDQHNWADSAGIRAFELAVCQQQDMCVSSGTRFEIP